MTQALSALLAKLEAATGPSREYDAEIARAVGWHLRDGMYGLEWIAPEGRMRGLPHFTESLDCAMTLARNQREAMVMMSVAFHATGYREPDQPVNLWPAIRAALMESIRARLAGQKE